MVKYNRRSILKKSGAALVTVSGLSTAASAEKSKEENDSAKLDHMSVSMKGGSISTNDLDSGGGDGSTWQSNTQEGVIKGHNAVGSVLWHFHHEIEWEYHTTDEEVRDCKARSWGIAENSNWSYNGTIEQWMDVEASKYNSYRQGQFNLATIGGTVTDSVSPYMEIKGTYSGLAYLVGSSRGDDPGLTSIDQDQ